LTLTADSDYTYNLGTGAVSITGSKITGKIEIIASGVAKTYTIAYNLNGGSQTGAPENFTFGTAVILPTPTKTGYTFGGWYTDSELTNKVAFPFTTTSNVTFFAKWSIYVGNPDEEPQKDISGSSSANGSNSVNMQYSDINGIGSGNLGISVGDTTLNIPAAIITGLTSDDTSSTLQLTEKPADTAKLNALSELLPSQNSIVTTIDFSLVKTYSDGTTIPIHQLGGKIKITLALTDEQLSKITDASKAKLYYFNTDTNALEMVDATFDLNNKTVTFYTDHFSIYIIGISDSPPNPKTGSGNSPILPVGFALAGSIGLLVATKLRKKWHVKVDKAAE
jgi:uncharacterized repeat protein (TIGR02543 family)/LPXTG-motif cell wall-anchored protein